MPNKSNIPKISKNKIPKYESEIKRIESRFSHLEKFFKLHYIVIFIFVVCGYLSFKHLGSTPFWDDEAQVGIIAKNFLDAGTLTGWDGRNLYAIRNGAALDANLRLINPPLDCVVCAASFKIFGISTWAGRFPFVIAGLLSIAVIIFLLPLHFGKDKWLWFYVLAVLSMSTIFLLYIRQCRYYSLTMLFSLLTFYYYHLCITKKHIIYFILLSLSLILLFYSHFLICAAFLLALIIYHFLFYRREIGLKAGYKILISIGIFLTAVLPYAIYYRIWHRPDIVVNESWLPHRLKLLWWNIRDLNTVTFMPWTIFIGLVCCLIYYYKKDPIAKKSFQWLVIAFLNVFFIALLSPQATDSNTFADIRYLIVSMPFFLSLNGIFLFFVNRWNKFLAFFLFLTLITCNILALPRHKLKDFPTLPYFQWMLPAYISELHHNYPTAYNTTINYLIKNTAQDDYVFIYPDYATYPLMFYLSQKLKFCGLLYDEASPAITEKMKKLAPFLFINDDNYPKWIITLGINEKAKQILGHFARPHKNNGKDEQFKYKLINVFSIFYLDTSRPEVFWHNFRPTRGFDANTDSIYIFEKIKQE